MEEPEVVVVAVVDPGMILKKMVVVVDIDFLVNMKINLQIFFLVFVVHKMGGIETVEVGETKTNVVELVAAAVVESEYVVVPEVKFPLFFVFSLLFEVVKQVDWGLVLNRLGNFVLHLILEGLK